MLKINKKNFLLKAKKLEGKTFSEINKKILKKDEISRVKTKGSLGYEIEEYFGIKKNSSSLPDIEFLEIEIKTSPLKFNKEKIKLTSKEPLSLNIINYIEEAKNKDIKTSSIYKKNKEILFVFYIHDKDKKRSDYLIKYVFLWKMDDEVLKELNPDYLKIIEKIKKGKAHEIHQKEHIYLTICPKHSGKFKDPNCNKSKRKQPFAENKAEVRAFRLKNKYMNLILTKYLNNKTP